MCYHDKEATWKLCLWNQRQVPVPHWYVAVIKNNLTIFLIIDFFLQLKFSYLVGLLPLVPILSAVGAGSLLLLRRGLYPLVLILSAVGAGSLLLGRLSPVDPSLGSALSSSSSSAVSLVLPASHLPQPSRSGQLLSQRTWHVNKGLLWFGSCEREAPYGSGSVEFLTPFFVWAVLQPIIFQESIHFIVCSCPTASFYVLAVLPQWKIVWCVFSNSLYVLYSLPYLVVIVEIPLLSIQEALRFRIWPL